MNDAFVLIGNAFSFTLFRGHKVKIEELSHADFRSYIKGVEVVSFWGHENSRLDVEGYFGIKLKTKVERPIVKLSDKGYPMLDGKTFTRCFVISPHYIKADRPMIGTEVSMHEIAGWHVLQLTWLD